MVVLFCCCCCLLLLLFVVVVVVCCCCCCCLLFVVVVVCCCFLFVVAVVVCCCLLLLFVVVCCCCCSVCFFVCLLCLGFLLGQRCTSEPLLVLKRICAIQIFLIKKCTGKPSVKFTGCNCVYLWVVNICKSLRAYLSGWQTNKHTTASRTTQV